MPGKVTEFDKLRRQRRRKKRVRGLISLAALLVLGIIGVFVAAVVYQLDVVTQVENFGASLKSGGSFPVSTREIQVRELLPIGKDVVVVSDSGVAVYNSRGTLLVNQMNKYTSPVVCIAGGKILTYDVGGTGLRVDNKARELYSADTPGRLFCADLAASGHFVTAVASEGYLARVTVFGPKFDERYNWYTRECYITDLSMSPRGDSFCAAGVNAGEGGRIVSHLRFHRISEGAEAAKVLLPDELVLSMVWTGRDTLQVITDRAAYRFSDSGSELARVELPGGITHLENSPRGGFFVAHGDYRSAGGAVIDSYDQDLKLVGSCSTARRILSLSESGGRLLILTEGRLLLGNTQLTEVQERRDTTLYYVCCNGNTIYGITPEGLIREAL